MNEETREELEKLTDEELLERLKDLILEDKFGKLLDEIDEIKEQGFSEMEAIEILKVLELRELNEKLNKIKTP